MSNVYIVRIDSEIQTVCDSLETALQHCELQWQWFDRNKCEDSKMVRDGIVSWGKQHKYNNWKNHAIGHWVCIDLWPIRTPPEPLSFVHR